MRTDAQLHVSASHRRRLEALIANPYAPSRIVRRARIVLMTADGCGDAEIRWRTGNCRTTVSRWQSRFREAGVDGLLQNTPQLRRAPLGVMEATEGELFPDSFDDLQHWTGRGMTGLAEIAFRVVERIWRSHGLQLRRPRQTVVSNDPEFVHKVWNIICLYLRPPPNAVVLGLDEKSQILAGRARAERLARGELGDYGQPTTNMYAVLDVHGGRVIHRCMQRMRHQELIRVLNTIEAEIPAEKDVHLIMDNYAPHRHPGIVRWLARHPRFHIHYTPIGMSWLNAVELVFAKAERRCLRPRDFRSIIEIHMAIKAFVADENAALQPLARC